MNSIYLPCIYVIHMMFMICIWYTYGLNIVVIRPGRVRQSGDIGGPARHHRVSSPGPAQHSRYIWYVYGLNTVYIWYVYKYM